MSWVPLTSLFVAAWLATYAQTQFPMVRLAFGIPFCILPALAAYVAMNHSILITTVFTVVTALGVDSLSANRFGVSVVPFFLFGFIAHISRHVLLQDQRYTQFWLGFTGGILVPLGTLAMLFLGQREPMFGSVTIRQLLLLGLLNGLVCPAFFWLFDRIQQGFDYQPLAVPSFRPDREIKRGRT
ncbi:MAG: hypothetical protein EXS36_17975 [Pedosphaera sp.]|nr:hypothetical protein [Pedosphaera sp.]